MLKNVVALAAALVCGAASAATPLTLIQDPVSPGIWSVSFSGLATGDNVFTFDLSTAQFRGWTDFDLRPLVITASSSGKQGYDVTNVTFDGVAINASYDASVPGLFSADVWTWSDVAAPGLHTIVVSGKLLGGSTGFGGSLNIVAQPVPEPESYALMLAGLAGIGAIVRRRSSR